MFTTGTKFLVGATVVSIIVTIVYGVTQDGVMGTVGLISASVALAMVTGVNLFTRDANIFVDDEAAVATCPASRPAPGPSPWPLLFAIGAFAMVLGLVTVEPMFIIGIVVMFAGGAEWTAQAWAERASSSTAHNSEVRSRIANPIEYPIGGAAIIGVIAYSFSRIMLWLSKINVVIVFSVVGACILAAAFFFAYRPNVKRSVMVGTMSVAGVALVAGGVVTGLDGERDIHVLETAQGEAAAGLCEDPEKTEADSKAAQTVAAQASVAAEITLNDDGKLTKRLNGPAESSALTLPRSNPSNVLFRNESSEKRRLSVDLGETEIGADSIDTERIQVCTALVEEGGVQNITLNIGPPSNSVEGGYFFFVPGVESAVLELIVP
ncbi:MAG: hypothetical protein HRT86_11375 [Ilumatobacteraceae bacterium]|nr:hypothetical protein [Ilumatobacteraceae bacterium]